MLIPYQVIVELLAPYEPDIGADPGKGAAYQWVELFSPEFGFESNDTVYVAPLSVARDFRVPDGFLCICPSDLEKGDKTTEKQPGLLVLGKKVKVSALIRIIKDFIIKLQKWETAMMKHVMDKDLQGILQATGAIIGNTLLLYNERYRLLAYYTPNPNDAKYYSEIIEANVSRSDQKASFAGLELPLPPSDLARASGVEHSEGRFVARTIFVQDYPRGQVYMFSGQDTATPGRTALFEIMLESLKVFFEREAPIVENSKNIEAFLIDLVENRSTDPVSVGNRADYCGIPAYGAYCLFVVRFKNYFRDIEAKRLLKKLSAILPTALTLQYNDSIMIINYYKAATNRSESDDWVMAIRDILKEADAEMGLAMPEELLGDLHISYKRAILAIEYGKRIHRKRPMGVGRADIDRYQGYDIYAYETYYIYHIIDMINTENRTILESSLCIRALAKLYALDSENKTDNLKLLYNYLINERSASKTAADMHMHRNNVIYRIDRIGQILAVDLNEYHIRFKFLFSYRVLDYYGFDFLKDIDYSTIGSDMLKKRKGETP